MIDHEPTSRGKRMSAEWLRAACVCGSDLERAASDRARRVSTHRTSVGHVVYYRCYCGHPGVALVRWPHRLGPER